MSAVHIRELVCVKIRNESVTYSPGRNDVRDVISAVYVIVPGELHRSVEQETSRWV